MVQNCVHVCTEATPCNTTVTVNDFGLINITKLILIGALLHLLHVCKSMSFKFAILMLVCCWSFTP